MIPFVTCESLMGCLVFFESYKLHQRRPQAFRPYSLSYGCFVLPGNPSALIPSQSPTLESAPVMPWQGILPLSSTSGLVLPFLGSLPSFLAGTQMTVEIHPKDTTPQLFKKLSFGKGTAWGFHPSKAGKGWEGKGASSFPLHK